MINYISWLEFQKSGLPETIKVINTFKDREITINFSNVDGFVNVGSDKTSDTNTTWLISPCEGFLKENDWGKYHVFNEIRRNSCKKHQIHFEEVITAKKRIHALWDSFFFL